MYSDPTLAARSLPAGTNGYRVPLTFRVEGGLHYLAGNTAPYFTLTYTQHRAGHPNQCYSGGAGHDVILRYFPRFADLAALHLSSIDGVPMYAEANGWYWLAGALGGADEQYHGGNNGQKLTEADCLDLFAKLCRVTTDEAAAIRDAARDEHDHNPDGWAAARALWCRIMEGMRPRWKAEAEAAIAAHGLRIYGDPWPPVAVA